VAQQPRSRLLGGGQLALVRHSGFSTQGSLAFLLVLNGGAVVGALIGSRIADRLGPKPVVAGSFPPRRRRP